MHDRPLTQLSQILETRGLDAGLGFLNERVPHRSSAVFVADGLLLRMVGFHDELGAQPLDFLRTVPFASSFCQFALEHGIFVTADATQDPRLDGALLRQVISSYVGLPVIGPQGPVGSFCHFDLMQKGVHVPDEELQLLQQAMPLLVPYVASVR